MMNRPANSTDSSNTQIPGQQLLLACPWNKQVRGKMYELLANCIPPELIVKGLLENLLRKLDDDMKAVRCTAVVPLLYCFGVAPVHVALVLLPCCMRRACKELLWHNRKRCLWAEKGCMAWVKASPTGP